MALSPAAPNQPHIPALSEEGAATTIQAAWRGHLVRSNQKKCVLCWAPWSNTTIKLDKCCQKYIHRECLEKWIDTDVTSSYKYRCFQCSSPALPSDPTIQNLLKPPLTEVRGHSNLETFIARVNTHTRTFVQSSLLTSLVIYIQHPILNWAEMYVLDQASTFMAGAEWFKLDLLKTEHSFIEPMTMLITALLVLKGYYAEETDHRRPLLLPPPPLKLVIKTIRSLPIAILLSISLMLLECFQRSVHLYYFYYFPIPYFSPPPFIEDIGNLASSEVYFR